ncbi:MAG: insulinase family protein [Thermoclostridium sp.]|nr:insulinase family protein [Thermoclostridium sp.]
MENPKSLVAVKKLFDKDGISFYSVPSDKFKTVRIDIFLVHPLQKETVSENALFPYVLRRGCNGYPTQQDLALRLEELYGASIEAGVYKKGELQILHFYSGFVSDLYTSGKTNLFEEAGSLLLEVLTEPVTEDGLFRQDYFEQEKENLIQRIRSRVNDKMQYAIERCFEEMCANEPYALHEDGDETGAAVITRDGLMNRYRAMLAESPIYVYISGNVREDEIKRFTDKFNLLDRNVQQLLKPSQVQKQVLQVKRVEEPMDVSQGQLCLGFRTQIEAGSPDYFPLAIYNGILGGGVQSKLFQNVREKESLAYTTFTRLEKFRGLLIAASGIEIDNREKAENIIQQQLQAIRDGDITDLEMEATKNSYQTGLKSMQDTQGAMVDFFLSQLLSGDNDTADTFLEKLMKVEKQDVVRISKDIALDTVYFLTASPERQKE